MAELDIQTALKESYQKIDARTLYQRATQYLATSGKNVAGLKAVDKSSVDFYDDYSLLITDFAYGNTTKSLSDMSVYEQTYSNTSPDNPLEATFSYTESHQDTQTFSFTEGLKIGAKASFKASLPLVGEGSAEVSTEVSFSATQTVSTTSTTTWQLSEKITVKPNSAVKATGFIRIAKMSAPFSCKVRVTGGKTLVWFAKTDSSFTELPIPVADLMTDEDRSFSLSGKLDGSAAMETYVKVVPAALTASAR